MSPRSRPGVAGALLLAVAACGGEEPPAPFPPGAWWPAYGRDLDNSRANPDEVELTPETVGGLVPVWRYAGPGVTSTPVVVDGQVFIGTWRGRLVVLDAVTGAVVRELALPGAGTVDATPCVTADHIYVGDGTGTLHAIDRATGAVRWSTPLDPGTPTAHLYGSPVYLADAGLVVSGVASIELTLDGVTDYHFRGSIVAVDAATGAPRWRRYLTADDATAGAGVSVWSTAAVDPARRLLFIGTGQSYEAPASSLGDALVAIRYDTGELAWHRQFTADDVFTFFGGIEGPDFDVGAAPNLFTVGGRDVVGVADKAGVYSTLDRDTGEIIWARQLTVGSHLGGVMVTAAVHGGSIYVVSNRWATYDDFGDPRNTSVAFGLDAATGVARWQTPLAAPSFGAVSWAGGVVYVGTIDGTFHALAGSDGRSLWHDPSLQPIGGGATIAAGRLLVPHGFVFLGAPGEAEGGVTAYGLP